jgi:ribosomal protein S18 acetylase RimI-like enzyme
MELEETQVTDAEIENVVVRTMRETDLDAVVRIDAAHSGRRRPQYFQAIFDRAMRQSVWQVSLVAESDGSVSGFVIASLYYGEFGIVEPSASIDAIGVDPEATRQRIGHALMQQLLTNLAAVRVVRIRTEVSWSDFDLLAFFKNEGFAPAARLCLERQLED